MRSKKFKVVILGAGSGGVSLAARLSNQIPQGSIAIVDPSDKHYYQPLWSLVGAGEADFESTVKDTKDIIPEGVQWLRESVLKVDAQARKVYLSSEYELQYEVLVVATGLRLKWEAIEGLNQSDLGQNGLCSIYQADSVLGARKEILGFNGGKAIFVMPPVPIKCAGAPQKIMYLAEEVWRERGVRHKSEIFFATAGKAMFGIPVFANALAEVVKEKNIQPLYSHKIAGVDAKQKKVFFDVTDEAGKIERKELQYDLLHLVPPMEAHSYVRESGLAATEGDQKGWLAVDKFSLQHLQYPEIFGIGDVTGVPNSKTGAAIRKQTPVVEKNVLSFLKGEKGKEKYDGYSSCPLITDIGKVMLAEFGYDGKLMPTFPLDPTVRRRTMWHLKKDLLPVLYWQGMLKGRA